jgi:hypothetical protein
MLFELPSAHEAQLVEQYGMVPNNRSRGDTKMDASVRAWTSGFPYHHDEVGPWTSGFLRDGGEVPRSSS